MIKEIIGFLKKKTIKRLERNHRFLELLKRLEITELKPTFDSVYTHALVKYSNETEPVELVKLFALKEVKKAFGKEFYNDSGKEGVLATEVSRQFQDKEELAFLKKIYSNAAALNPEIEKFKECFNHFRLRSSTPGEVKAYNEMNRFMLEMLEEKQRKSFDYQVEQYLTRLRDDFQKEFLEEKLYVDLNGETRIEKRREFHVPGKAGEEEIYKARRKKEQEESERYEIIPHEPLDTFINQWLHQDGANLLVILGEYGTGKTTFCRHLAHQMAVKRLETGKDPGPISIHDPKNRIPLYFPLRYFEKNIEPFIVNRFSNEGITDIDYPAFLQRVNDDEFVVLLDGFDEMTQKIDADEKSKNFDKICKVIDSSRKSKILLTTREEYFQSQPDFEAVFKCRDKESYHFVHLRPFNDKQIQRYLKTHTDNPEFYWEQIQNIFDLHDLAKRPVLLQLIVDHLPALIKEKGKDRPINASDLYKKCIQEELRRKSTELDFIIPGKYRLKILQKLAVWMFLKDELVFDVMMLEDELNLRQYFQSKTPWEFEKHLNEFLTFTFLIREGDNQYRISHKSFRDYLTAQVFVEEINSGNVDNFSRVRITYEVNRFTLEQGVDRERLLDLVLNAKDLSEANQWQGTNAAYILLGVDKGIFRNCDLSGCRLTHVDFWRCDLTNTDFRQANLSHCSFGKEILSARLTGIIVEQSYLNLSYEKMSDLPPLKELKQLMRLNLYNNQVRDLTPLKELEQLTRLNLYDNQVRDLTPLKELKQLTQLDFSGNQVRDLTPLMELKQLTQLDCGNNEVGDLTPLKELKQLTQLDCRNNEVGDLTPLKELKQLAMLNLSQNQVSDLTPLKELKQLAMLNLFYNHVSNLMPLKELTQLKEFDFSANEVSDLTPLKELKQLTKLDLYYNPLSDLTPLKGLKQLKELNLWINHVSNLTPLKDLKQLNDLNISKNLVGDLTPLKGLRRLTYLDLSYNRVRDLIPLKELKQLWKLDFSFNQVSDLAPLKDLRQLTNLNISENQVSDLTPLKELKQLTELDFGGNEVSDLTPLKELKQLMKLDFSVNQVSDLTPLKALKQLKELNIRSNYVNDLTPLMELKQLNDLRLMCNSVSDLTTLQELKHLKKLDIRGNPVSEAQVKALQQALPELIIY